MIRFNKYSIFILFFLVSCKKESPDTVKNDIGAEILIKLNKFRTTGCKCGIDSMPPAGKVIWNLALERTSFKHAEDMLNRNYFSHITPEGIPAIQRSRQEGYTGTSIGEVIARNYTTVDEVILGWKNSESHCKAMMDTSYTEAGAGKAGSYWVMDLGGEN